MLSNSKTKKRITKKILKKSKKVINSFKKGDRIIISYELNNKKINARCEIVDIKDMIKVKSLDWRLPLNRIKIDKKQILNKPFNYNYVDMDLLPDKELNEIINKCLIDSDILDGKKFGILMKSDYIKKEIKIENNLEYNNIKKLKTRKRYSVEFLGKSFSKKITNLDKKVYYNNISYPYKIRYPVYWFSPVIETNSSPKKYYTDWLKWNYSEGYKKKNVNGNENKYAITGRYDYKRNHKILDFVKLTKLGISYPNLKLLKNKNLDGIWIDTDKYKKAIKNNCKENSSKDCEYIYAQYDADTLVLFDPKEMLKDFHLLPMLTYDEYEYFKNKI